MSLTLQDYYDAIRSNTRHPIAKIEILDKNENVLDEISEDIIDGHIVMNLKNGVRRSASLTLKNNNGNFIPSYRGKLWLDKRIRIYSGLNINGEDFFFSKGIFLISEPQINSNFSDNSCEITLTDKFSLLNGEIAGDLKNTYIIPVGTNIEDAVRSIFQLAGEVKTPIIHPTSETTPYTIIKQPSDTYASLLLDLANMLSWVVYYDKNGYPHFEPPVDENNKNSVWDYSVNEVNYLGSSHRYKFNKVKNSCTVIGDNINGSLVRAEVQDNYIFSPTRIDLIGERQLVITDDLIYNNNLALQRAEYELKNNIILQESVELQSIPLDIINEGDVITIEDSKNGLNRDRFLVKSVNLPLLLNGNMSLECWKIRLIS